MENQLIHFNRAKQEIALATKIDEVKEIRDKAEALRIYSKQAGHSFEMQNQCAEIKVRAERRAGELLREKESAQGKRTDLVPRWNQVDNKKTLDDLGISKKQSHRWKQIASIPEDDFDKHIEGKKQNKEEITSVDLLKKAKKIKKNETLKENEPSINACSIIDLNILLDKGIKFKTIYADPPWNYSNQATRASTDNHYKTMTVDEIAALPVKELADTNAHLHLWTTNAFIFECPKILEAWGFEYKSIFVWVKPQIGMGNYWRVSHEFMVLGVRGSLTFLDKNYKSWIEVKRGEHSAKPDEIRKIIEQVSPGPRLELFGRKEAPNWVVWGNQIQQGLFLDQINECIRSSK